MSDDAPKPSKSLWRPIVPVPEEVDSHESKFQPNHNHHTRGGPKEIFIYRDGAARLWGYVCRFITSSGEALHLTQTWCVNEKGERAWRWKQFARFRPLYGLQELAERPDDQVIVVFDEMAARAMRQLDPTRVPVSWPGGIKKIAEVDWSPLRGRSVIIWPDHGAERIKATADELQTATHRARERQPNVRAAQAIAEVLRAFQATPWTILDTGAPESLEDGWNAIDAANAGWTQEQFLVWMVARLGNTWPKRPEPGAADREPAGGGGDWRRELIRKDDDGQILPELFNVRMILSNHEAWQKVIYEDLFSHRIMKAKAPPFAGGDVGEWGDVDDSLSHEWLAAKAKVLRLRTGTVAQAVQTVAKLNARNLLTEFLSGLRWDGKPRMNTWLREYVGAGQANPDESEADAARMAEYLRIVGRKWLIGAVARAIRPGIKFDYVLILEGQQGLGKSSALAIIGGDWTMETPFSLSDKEGMEAIRGMWVVEIAELDSFNKAENTTAKTFFSRRKDRFRLPYGKRSADFPRSCVFAGTTNENEYFRDMTGNRRYMPVRCRRLKFDAGALTRDREQLLAEAVHAFLVLKEPIFPNREEEKILREEQTKREIPDAWTPVIATWLAGEGPLHECERLKDEEGSFKITMRVLLTRALGIERGRIDERGHATRVGRILRKLGYVKREDRTSPDRYYYVKRQSSDEDDEVAPSDRSTEVRGQVGRK